MSRLHSTATALLMAMGTATCLGPAHAQDQPAAPLPDGLSADHAPFFRWEGAPLPLADRRQEEDRTIYVYEGAGGKRLTLEFQSCESPACETHFDNVVRFVDKRMAPHGGRFLDLNSKEFHARFEGDGIASATYGFRLPHGLQFWTYTNRSGDHSEPPDHYGGLRAATDQQRYSDALGTGNVEVGQWSAEILRLAQRLDEEDRRLEALKVLRDLLQSAADNLEAHMLLADLALDPAARQASARVVFDNAEELELRRRAAQVLGEEIPDMEDLPYIQPGERGLQLILVALPPCDVQIVREAAALFTEVTGVPAKLVQLHADWNFGSPDRVPRQKTIQRFLASLPGGPADFSGWKMEDYEAALRQRLGDAAPLDRFHITQFLEDFPTWSGQYHVVPPLNVLAALVAEYRTSDFRTVYVGVTAANIYDEDVNYLFSAYAGSLGQGVSLLSYAMTTAKELGEANQSRPRLVDRLTKEMIPAAFKALGLPRPADPSDPYSYSSGIKRTDQKRLKLSPPTREALDKLR